MSEKEQNHILRIAKALHDHYETQSKKTGWETQKECQVAFKDLPQKNQDVMIDITQMVVGAIILTLQEFSFFEKINYDLFVGKFTSFFEEKTKKGEQEK